MSTYELETVVRGSPEVDRAVSEDACWEALTSDTGCDVVILDERGRVEYCNDAAGRRVEGEPTHLRDLYPEPIAVERLAFARDAAASDAPVAVCGLIRGERRRTVFRALDRAPDGTARVLMVCRVAGPADADDETITAKQSDGGAIDTLTPREVEVLSLIGRGLSTAQIAKELHRSVKTVEWHRVSLGNKLGASNRVELARIAIRAGVSELSA